MDTPSLLKKNIRSTVCSYADQSPPLSEELNERSPTSSSSSSLLTSFHNQVNPINSLNPSTSPPHSSPLPIPSQLPSSSSRSDHETIDNKSIDTENFFRFLIDEAHEMPIHDFQLSPSYLKPLSTNITTIDTISEVKEEGEEEEEDQVSSTERMNPDTSSQHNDNTFENAECELETEEEFKEQPTLEGQQPFILLDSKELIGLRSNQSASGEYSPISKVPNSMIRIKVLNNSDSTKFLPTEDTTTPGDSSLRPIKKVYLGKNFYGHNDGVVKLKCPKGATVEEYLGRVQKRLHSSQSAPPKATATTITTTTTTTITSNPKPTTSCATSTNIISNPSSQLLKKCSTDYRNNCLPGTFVKSKFVQNLSYHKDARPRYFSDHSDEEASGGGGVNNNGDAHGQNARLQQFHLQMELRQKDILNQCAAVAEEEQDFRFASLKAANSDRIVKLYAVQAVEDNDIGKVKSEENELETQILILVQHHFVNIWFKMDESHWKNDVLTTKKDEKIFTTELVRFPGVICLFCLATDMQSVYLKYCKIDLEARNACYLWIETFKNISIDQFDFIHLGQITQDKIAISIPRMNEPKVDLFMYQLEVKQCNLTNLKKSLLHTFDRTSECPSNCVFRIQELKDRFVCIFNQSLYIWNLKPGDHWHKVISLQKYTSSSMVFFDAFYDRGLVYLFTGHKYNNQVKVLAVNLERLQVSKLMSYDVEGQLGGGGGAAAAAAGLTAADRLMLNVSSKQTLRSLPMHLKREVKLFKRKGDQLIVIKRDATLIIYSLITNEVVFEKQLQSLHDACIGCLNGDAVIFAASGRQMVINLFN